MNAKPSAEILAVLAEKINGLRDFLGLTDALRQNLLQKNLADVPRLLKERSRLIQRMDRGGRQIESDRLDSSSMGKNLSLPLRSRLDSMVQEWRDLLQRTAAADRQCLKEAQAFKDAIQEELGLFRNNMRVARTYAGRPILQPRFMDTRE